MKYPTLYNIDENNNVRVWWMETEMEKYRTVSGIEGGAMVESEWTVAEPKNVGRANETTAIEQADLEVRSKYKKKKEQKYSEEREQASRSNILQPMLAHGWKDIKNKEQMVVSGVFSQPKLDGIRCLVSASGMMSRTGKPIVSCPHIRNQLDDFFSQFPNITLDGELYNHDLNDDFNTIASLITKKKADASHFEKTQSLVEYHVYDIIGLDATFTERSDFMKTIEWIGPLRMVQTTYINDMDTLDSMYGDYMSNGYEGQMIRSPNSRYQHKRSKDLLKRKEFQDEEFHLTGIQEGKGNWSGYAKVANCYDSKNDVHFSAGIRGTQDQMRQLLNEVNEGKKYTSVTIRYQNKTPDGIPRFPIATMFHEDTREY